MNGTISIDLAAWIVSMVERYGRDAVRQAVEDELRRRLLDDAVWRAR